MKQKQSQPRRLHILRISTGTSYESFKSLLIKQHFYGKYIFISQK